MLKMTSKKVKEVVDKVHPPGIVRWSCMSFLGDKLNGTQLPKTEFQFVIRQLTAFVSTTG
jgi:hypothetical protein